MYIYKFEVFKSQCELHIEIDDKSVAENVARAVLLNAQNNENRYSFFKNSSELYAINHRTTNKQIVSEELAGLIKLALFYYDKTSGVFDIAMAGTLKEAFFESTLEKYNDKVKILLPFASSLNISIKENELTFSNDITKIDLGGLVKEYTVDESIFLLKQAGVNSALVNFGGDISVFGTYNSSLWSIGIENPKNHLENIAKVKLNENSLCTSGESKHFYTIEKEKKSHIISKNQKSYSQVSVIASSTVDAGIWSTALLANPNLTIPAHVEVVSTYENNQ